MVEEYKEQKRGNPWLKALVIILVVVALGIVVLPVVMKTNGPHYGSREMSNAKQIYYLLIEFDQDYGQFPGDATADEHKEFEDADYEDHSFKGGFSNDYLGQFIANGYTKSEEIFYARGAATNKKRPDNDISSWSKVLEAGECGFSYVKNQSSTSSGAILMTPMNRSGTRFDPLVLHGKCVMLRADGVVQSGKVDQKTGIATWNDGQPLFPQGFDLKNLMYPK